MSKLEVYPKPDITFEVVNGKANICPLRLYNAGTEHTAFKVKTTAPKKYCVRPNAAIIPPGKHVEVQVIPQNGKGVDGVTSADLQGKCKDKFMIQSTTVKGDDVLGSELWNSVPAADLQQTLLRCKYKTAIGGDVGSIPEGDASSSMFQTAAFNVNTIDFSNQDAVKNTMISMNKDFENQALASSRKIRELQEENAKLSSTLSKVTGAPPGSRPLAPGFDGAVGGFTPLFVLLVALVTYVFGVYTSLATLPK